MNAVTFGSVFQATRQVVYNGRNQFVRGSVLGELVGILNTPYKRLGPTARIVQDTFARNDCDYQRPTRLNEAQPAARLIYLESLHDTSTAFVLTGNDVARYQQSETAFYARENDRLAATIRATGATAEQADAAIANLAIVNVGSGDEQYRAEMATLTANARPLMVEPSVRRRRNHAGSYQFPFPAQLTF